MCTLFTICTCYLSEQKTVLTHPCPSMPSFPVAPVGTPAPQPALPAHWAAPALQCEN